MTKPDDRTIVVTGGTTGIGRAIAGRFAASGARVFVMARRPPQDPLPDGMAFLACDVAQPGQPEAALRQVGGLDVLVNAAGLAGARAFGSEEEATLWHAVLAVNLTGTWACCRAAFPLFPERGGSIVNIASVLGLRAVPDQPAYCAAKHGVIGLTRSLALAFASRAINVNAICPGWVKTTMAEQRWRDLSMTEAEAKASAPTGRITTPEEVAALAFYLASAEAGNVTGQAVVMDGGESI